MSRPTSARNITTKRAVAAEVARHGSGPVLVAAIGAGVTLRRLGGRPGPADLATAAVVTGLQPFVEWGLHRFILHGDPLDVGPLRLDPGASHRAHHLVPDDVAGALLGTSFAVSDALAVALVATIVALVVGGRGTVGTAIAAGETGLLGYEWTHLLAHSGYRPRTAWFRHLRASHLRHHHRDETTNFGITSRLGDRLFGTAA